MADLGGIKAKLAQKTAMLKEVRDHRRKLKQEQEVEEENSKGGVGDAEAIGGDEGIPSRHEEFDQVVGASSWLPIRDNELTPGPSCDKEDPPHQQKRSSNLTISQVIQTNIPTQEKYSYSKETQTSAPSRPNDSDGDTPASDHNAESEELPPEAEEVRIHEQQNVPAKDVPKDLSEEQKQIIIMSPAFQMFVDKSTRIMERALSEQARTQKVDIFADYAKSADIEQEKSATPPPLCLNRVFYDEKWSKNRCVTSLDWSTHYPELLAASYSVKDVSASPAHDPEGVCLIWNTKFSKTSPEFIFHCSSPVLSCAFARFHPNLVLGGTYSGSVVLWDNRVPKRSPAQASSLSDSARTGAHTHPVYCLKVVGTQNSHSLISTSTDGRLCSWSLDMLSRPQETLDLRHKKGTHIPVAATCLAFPQGPNNANVDGNNFLVGSENGNVYSGCGHGTGAAKAGLMDEQVYKGHRAPITGIHTHTAADFSDLFLTSSFDWSVKLWSTKEPTRPLYSFEVANDAVYDVAWSPVNPAVFASVDGDGKLDLWNLNGDTELPSASVKIDGQVALNKVSWSQSGLQVVAGDDSGKTYVYNVGEKLANPQPDEWQRFAKTLAELKCDEAEMGTDFDDWLN